MCSQLHAARLLDEPLLVLVVELQPTVSLFVFVVGFQPSAMQTFQAFCGNIPCEFSEADIIQSFTYHEVPAPFKAVARESHGNSAGRDKYAIAYWHNEVHRDMAIAKGPVMSWIPGRHALIRLPRCKFLCMDAFYCCRII